MTPYEIPDKIDEAFVQGLVDKKQPENKHFEFKQQLDIKSDKDIRTLLGRASAFANTEGGYLIYGIREFEGTANEICGIDCPQNDDALRQSIESHIRNWVDSDLVDVDVVPVTMQSGNRVLVLHVPKSQSIPHMVTHSEQNRIYKRHSSGIYPPGLEELRQMFSTSASLEAEDQEFRTFHESRIHGIMKGDINVLTWTGNRFVLHIAPSNKSANRQLQDFSEVEDSFRRLGEEFGFTQQGVFGGEKEHFYHLMFHNRIAEFVQADLSKWNGNEIPISCFEGHLLFEVLPQIMKWQEQLKTALPFRVLPTLLNASGYKLGLNRVHKARLKRLLGFSVNSDHCHFSSNHVPLPQVAADTFEPNFPELMRPVFDRMWQAAGLPRSLNYDEDGNWDGGKQQGQAQACP